MAERELIWRTSSYSGTNGSCVEVATSWRTSSRSGPNGGNCVEVAGLADRVLVRDSKDRAGPVLAVDHADWRTFLAGLHAAA